MLPLGALIWIACRPLIRLAACVICGIIATKADIFPLVATKSASQIIINIGYPSLLFSKIVPASLSGDNIRALGPLVVIALVYELLGGLLGFIIKQFFWVPHRFRYGIILAGAFGNVGDIPTAIALGVTSSAPFNGTSDQNLSIAYISAFILVYVVTLFPTGLHKLIMWDFDGPGVEREEVMEATRRKRQAMLWRFRLSSSTSDKVREEWTQQSPVADEIIETKSTTDADKVTFQETETAEASPVQQLSRNRSPSTSETGGLSSYQPLEAGTPSAARDKSRFDLEAQDAALPLQSPTTSSKRYAFVISIFRTSRKILKDLLSPISLSIFISFPITLVPKLKALFVPVPGTQMASTPDGQPPLSFVLDVMSFIGNSAIPLALICLGSSLARLHIPKKGEWKKLPLGAIGSLAAGKMLIMPVLGILMCEGLTKAGFISKDDKVLRLICIFGSCLPTSTTQVFLTQAYSGTGSAEDISVFLIPQYCLMFVTMTTVTAYTLHILS